MKQRITVEEKVAFHHTIDLEIRDGEADAKIDEALDQNHEDFIDLCITLKQIDGVKLLDTCMDESGQSSEIECCDCQDIEEE
ncbi:hypothetical protein NE619_14765 [Anaerovorax odorimutans]|uniref:Uncharacterized protein n=1 Tax=Anaerovorax odorimutans TaxID=109327 RepID=A0ABT1RS65_9FIRM|nr:hypothetical protein [Anaerovorax odorimutans]MCQ4637996.1 hypothetical protein [Anaerovorax odorimutans]